MASEFTKEEVKQEITRRKAFDKRAAKVLKRYAKLSRFSHKAINIKLKELSLSEIYLEYKDPSLNGYNECSEELDAKILWDTDKILAKLQKEIEKDEKECEELRKARQVQEFVGFLEAYPNDAKKILNNRDLDE